MGRRPGVNGVCRLWGSETSLPGVSSVALLLLLLLLLWLLLLAEIVRWDRRVVRGRGGVLVVRRRGRRACYRDLVCRHRRVTVARRHGLDKTVVGGGCYRVCRRGRQCTRW